MIYDRELREKYHIAKSLGNSPQGELFLAEDVNEKEYLLKVFHEKIPKKQIEREVSLLLYIDHPHILRLKDFGELEDQRSYTITDYIKYGSISAPKIFPVPMLDDKIRFLFEAAQGLCYLHDKDIIHRNIKPENIFLRKEGEQYRACLGSFGLAKHLHDPQITKSEKGFAGTELFIPTETLAQKRIKLSKSTDIYAFGVSMYVALTGAFPYGHQLHHIVAQVDKPTTPKRIRDSVSHIPKDLEDLCYWMIQHREEDRPSNIEECRDILVDVLSNIKLYDNPKVVLPGPPKFKEEKVKTPKVKSLTEEDINALLANVSSSESGISQNDLEELLAEIPVEQSGPIRDSFSKNAVLSESEIRDLLAEVTLDYSEKKAAEPLTDERLPQTLAGRGADLVFASAPPEQKKKPLFKNVPKIDQRLQRKYRTQRKERERSKVQRVLYIYVGGTIVIHLIIQGLYEIFWR